MYIKAMRLLNMSGYKKVVRNLAVSVYDLIPNTSEQLELFASPTHTVSEAMDKINDRWGEFVVIPALMMGMGDIILVVTNLFTPLKRDCDTERLVVS